MQIIKPSAEIFNIKDKIELVERIGRVCYKSENMIKEGSAEKFVSGLMNRKHYAMIEHGHIIVSMTPSLYNNIRLAKNENGDFMYDLTYMNCTCDSNSGTYIMSGSFRAWRDMFIKAKEDICYLLCTLYYEYPIIFEDIINSIYTVFPTKEELVEFDECYVISEDGLKVLYQDRPDLLMEHITHTVHFVCDRGVSHEFVRHRNCAFAQESTRYCNYSKDKFGNEITVILPLFFDTGMGTDSNSLVYETWKHSCEVAERKYFELLNYGATPQEARSVLPNSLKTELVITATEKEWQHIINLRYHGTTGVPHPQMVESMSLIYDDLCKVSDRRLK